MPEYPHKLSAAQRRFLEDLFPGDASDFSPEALSTFGTDSGAYYARPWAVVRPENESQIVELLRWAQAERMPITPRGRGTNVVGDCTPVHGGVTVSLLRMNRILEISERDFVAVVEPGVVTQDLQHAVEDKGLFFPPDPGSLHISTIGGNVLTCAGGMRAVKYGVTRDYVLGMDAVLPGGRVMHLGSRCHKNVVGLDLTRLFVGSTGTLGIVTKLILKLLPLPKATASLLAGFDSLDAALTGARSMFHAGILPVSLELMDSTSLKAVQLVGEVPWAKGLAAALIIKVDGFAATLPRELDRVEQALAPAHPTHLMRGQGKKEEAIWEVRRLLNPAAFKLGSGKMAEDIAVPRGSVAEAVRRVREIAGRHGLRLLLFGHLGDGNLHVNMMYDAEDEAQQAQAAQARDEVFEVALALHGTCSGEHGIGLSKRQAAAQQVGEAERALMDDVRRIFDPERIMNPGKEW